MPVIVGAIAALLTFIVIGSLLAPLGAMGTVEIAVIAFVGLIAGVAAGVWEARRRRG
ncbi:hypothetical protein [Nonomuraea gerenzanensis]|uniref:Integral membrane protein n=1 Tax=Nonomuraea gerenzanensis TaxID=93944 RepID=A0A1M4EQX1_9ACTN|nr:hypothetical protein [Nonomuraea gerenzanensis]UBU12651.1 hypothetical protein LCN96_51750 [Nonomuraea gerenzanensis]SBP01207.1 hypothetical protein BN4615_P10723 [Nonomuraea gerenzanensis]